MCSIGGAIFKKPLAPDDARRIASLLLFIGRERGDQSAGFWLDGMRAPLKQAVPVDEFLDMPAWEQTWDKRRDVRVLLTHTRLPTSGGRESNCAQPFMAGNTVTVHNGHIMNPEQVERQFSFQRKTQVDSEIFARYIGRYGVRNLHKFLRCVSGNAAVAACHNGSLYAFRSGNPLCIAKIPGDGIIFGSTMDMVKYAVAALYGFFPEGCDFISIPENEVFKFHADGTIERVSSFRTMVSWIDTGNQYGWGDWGGYSEKGRPFEKSTGRIIKMGSLGPTTTPVSVEKYASQWIPKPDDDNDVIVIERPVGEGVAGTTE